MKEITRVHLAKTAFDVEVEAKKELEKYLKAIERAMDSDDAMREIEARMVELLSERGVSAGGVITAADVAALREQMGEPKEFSEDGSEPAAEPKQGEKPVKRLMRDTDNALLGGVCAGIAAYWGVNPLWIRIVAIISPFISFGTAILIYIVMWISMPEAKTAADKLQMRGEEVTFDSLKNFSVSDETKARTKTVFVKIVQVFAAFCLFMTTLGLLIALVVGAFFGVGIVSWMDGLAMQPWAWGLLVSLIVGGATAVVLSGALTSSAIRWKFSRATLMAVIITSVIGAISVSSIAIFGGMTAQEFARDEKRLTKTMVVELPENLDGVKYVRQSSMGQFMVFGVERGATSEKPRVELTYWAKDNVKPEVKVVREGDTLVLSVEQRDGRECRMLWIGIPRLDDCFGAMSLTVYGLELKTPDGARSVHFVED